MSKLKVELSSIDLVDLLVVVGQWQKDDKGFLPIKYAALAEVWLMQRGAIKTE